ncbi:S6 family peptidase [Mannheimia glucosida]|uniref:S6 family peptidase n=1 Tax=Mannheimia glucosida TaxID=85401 RepID=UPI0039182A6E
MKHTFKRSLLATSIAISLSPTLLASIVRGDVDYQYFRDLAENKGKFFVGATNIPVIDKTGKNIGTFLQVTPTKQVEVESNISPKPNVSLSECFDNESLPGCYEFLYGGGDEDSNDLPVFETVTGETMSIPMIDFSSITRQTGIATLVNPQYVISVNHNQGYRDIQFGDSSSEKADDHHYNYSVVRRNNYMPDPNKERTDLGKGTEKRERNDEGEKLILDGSGNPTPRWDYHAPRLSKLVTEVAPANEIERTTENVQDFYSVFSDPFIFPMFIRAGSGRQAVVNNERDRLNNGRIEVGNGPFLTGGSVLPVTNGDPNVSGSDFNSRILVAKTEKNTVNDVFKDHGYGPLTTLGLPGDSGSALFGYDVRTKKWVVLGVYSDYFSENNTPGGDVYKSYWNYHHPHYVRALEKENNAGAINANGARLTWTPSGNTSSIVGGNAPLTVNLADTSLPTLQGHNGNTGDNPWNPQLQHGKTFHILGENNTLSLTENINQGAGAIHFHGNTTVEGMKAGITWLGAGVDIDKDKNVIWKISNPAGDRLSKIGQGILTINGKGENKGSVSVGDGTVILNQQADENNKKSAFSELGIVSGRPTVILNSSDQMDPNNIYFGYRGGRLDVNGNDLTFRRIQNSDEGAMVVNHNTAQTANITLTGIVSPTIDQVKVQAITSPDQVSRHLDKDIFTYQRFPHLPTNFIRLKKPLSVAEITAIFNARKVFIDLDFTTGLIRENEYFEVLKVANESAAKQQILAEKIKAAEGTVQGFNGYFGETDPSKTNGQLNITMNSNEVANGKLLITGGTNLNGTLSAEGTSEIILSGRPTPHAYDKVANKEVLIEGDWLNRSFNATIFAAKDNGKLEISRNVSAVNGNFNLTDNATAQIGFTQGTSQACIHSDRTGVATCNINATLSETDLNSWERTKVAGNVSLADNSTFSLGSKADLTGSITAQESTKVQLNDGSIANLTGLSTTGIFNGANGSTVNLSGVWTTLTNTVVDVLNAANGSQIHLNTPTATKQNTLTANTLTGNGIFKFVADLTKTASDIVTIKDTASGQFSIEISTNGSAHSAQKIKLFETTNEEDFSLNLANEVRSGEYRYHLLKEGNVYYLNPEKEEEPKITQKGPSETADPLPEYTGDIEHSEKGPGETADPLPEYTGDIEHSEKGPGETTDPLPEYTGDIEHSEKGPSETADPLPEYTGDIEHSEKGPSETADPLPEYTGDIEHSEKGPGETADPLPEYTGDIEHSEKGPGETTDPLPEYTGDIEHSEKGPSETADPLPEYTGDIEHSEKGPSETADPLPEYTGDIEHSEKGSGETAEPLPEYTGDIEHSEKGPGETADPLPEYTGDIEHSEKGPGETADPLPEYTGDIEHSEKGSAETAEPLPKYNGNAHLIASELTAQTNAVLGVTTVLDHVIHSEGTQNWKVWSKTDYQTTEHRSAGYGFKQDANVIHLGLEKALDNQVTLGMILSQSKARNNFDHYYSGKGRLTMLSMYAKKTWQNGVFVAIDTGFGKASNRLTYQANTVKLDRSVFVTGLSIGKAWESANVNIIPSFSARYHHLSSAGNQLVDAKIETNAVDLLALQAGLSINKTLELNGLQITPEIGSYFVDASHGKLRTRFNNLQIEQQMGRYFKQEAGISANYRNINAGIQAGFLTGNTLNKQRYISFKVTYEW